MRPIFGTRKNDMNKTRNNRKARLHGVARAIIALPFALLSACDDAVGIDGTPSYITEAYHFSVQNGVQFGSAPDENGTDEALLMDVFQPAGDTEPLRPAVIWLHGGSFREGDKGEMTEFARRFAMRGYVSASANYRLRENVVFDYTDPDDAVGEAAKRDAQHDIQAAVRWLRANAETLRVDPVRIFLVGYSAGGTAALRVAAHPDDVGTSGNPGPSSSVAAIVAISVSLDPGTLESASASTLLIHGESDTKVPIAQVQTACSSVAACRLFPVPLAPHNMIQVEKETIIAETALFLNGEAT